MTPLFFEHDKGRYINFGTIKEIQRVPLEEGYYYLLHMYDGSDIELSNPQLIESMDEYLESYGWCPNDLFAEQKETTDE